MATSELAVPERRLADELGYAHAVLFGRARSALAALVEVVNPGTAFEILLPSNVCSALLVAVWWSQARVRLVPVDRTTGLVTDAGLAEAIRAAPGHGIAVATQLYGFRQSHPLTMSAARERGWMVVENDTLLTGAKSVGAGHSPFADAALASFGYAKTLDVGGGGAILTNEPSLAAELRRLAAAYPPLDEAAVRAENEAMFARRMRLARADSNELARLRVPRDPGVVKFRFPAQCVDVLSDALGRLGEIAARRRARAARWDVRLRPFGDALAETGLEQPLPWRVIRRAPEGRTAIVSALRRAGFDAGTNYPPLADEFPADLGAFMNDEASAWGAQVLNLWVSDDYDDARIDDAADVIARALDRVH